MTGTPGATLDQQARSYLAANCGFCRRPDVYSYGFDLRYSNTFFRTGLCGQPDQDGIPGMTGTSYLDFAPGDHAASSMWLRMNIPIPASDPTEMNLTPIAIAPPSFVRGMSGRGHYGYYGRMGNPAGQRWRRGFSGMSRSGPLPPLHMVGLASACSASQIGHTT